MRRGMRRIWALWCGFSKYHAGVAALFFLLALVLVLLFTPFFYQVDPDVTDRQAGFWAEPSTAHPLGTDDAGRDILARLIHGGRVSLLIGFSAALLSVFIGVSLGLLAGYRRGIWEYWIMRLVDVMQSFPSIILILCLVALVGPSKWNIVLVIGGLGWMPITRLIYGNTLAIAQQDYILAVRAMGAGPGHVLLRNILPNAMAPVWSVLPMRVGRAIVSESSLSFLGAGVRVPEASWGNMLGKAMELFTLTQRPWMWVPPALCIIATVLALQIIGDNLRKALNPRQ